MPSHAFLQDILYLSMCACYIATLNRNAQLKHIQEQALEFPMLML